MDEEDPPLFEWTCDDISVGDTDVTVAPRFSGKFRSSFVLSPTALQMPPPNKMPPLGPAQLRRDCGKGGSGKSAILLVMRLVTSRTIRYKMRPSSCKNLRPKRGARATPS